jgi:glycosyltransferase involved in cell wall biosynthesis
MNALDVLVLPSRTTESWKEQFGRVIIEAHACQTPVIGSSSGAIPDVVGAGGMVVPERDPSALAAAMMQMASSPEQRAEMGRHGRAQVEEHLPGNEWQNECIAFTPLCWRVNLLAQLTVICYAIVN